MMAVSRLRTMVVCVGFLCYLSSVLCQMYSDSDLCPIQVNTTNETLTGSGAIIVQTPCNSDFSECDSNFLNISVDGITYYGATTKVNVSVPSNTYHEVYYYKVCLITASTDEVELLQCLHRNGSSFVTDVYWNVTGQRELKVSMYNDSEYTNFVDCTFRSVLIANNSGLKLKVKISQPKDEELATPVIPVGPALPTGPVCKSVSKTPYRVGNLTFKSTVNFTNFTEVHLKYSFGDGQDYTVIEKKKNESTIKHYYSKEGRYDYSVDAVVVLTDNEVAVHSLHKNHANVYQTLTEHTIKVGGDNSVKVGMSDVIITLSGSFPVTFCWCMVFPNSTACSRVPQINSTGTNNITCIKVLQQPNQTHLVYKVKMNFTMSGTHQILANFSNIVDCRNKSFPFYVYSPPSPAVIISSTTVGILAALLAIVIVVVIIIVTVIIPYRRYKYRMTETANFKFIELSDSTATVRGKVRRVSRSFVGYFRSSSQDRIGLVNTESNDVTSSDRLLDRKKNNLVTFAPYDSL